MERLFTVRFTSSKSQTGSMFPCATTDGRNAIFMISEHEEQELIAAGRLIKERQLLTMASRALDRVEEETGSITPGRFGRPRQS
jgi:hypothetical protein